MHQIKRSYMVVRDRDQPWPLLSSCFQQQRHEKENLLCRLTIWDPKDELQSVFGGGPNTGCYDPISYWIPFCFLVCQPGRPQPPNSHLLAGRAGKDRANKAESTTRTHPQSTLEKKGTTAGDALAVHHLLCTHTCNQLSLCNLQPY